GHAGDHEFWRLAETVRPVLSHQIMIAADAAGGDDHGLRAQGKIAGDFSRAALAALDIIRLEDRATDAIDHAVGDRQRIDTMAEFECQPSAFRGLARTALERLDDAEIGRASCRAR